VFNNIVDVLCRVMFKGGDFVWIIGSDRGVFERFVWMCYLVNSFLTVYNTGLCTSVNLSFICMFCLVR
jgi:hypothetical protein